MRQVQIDPFVAVLHRKSSAKKREVEEMDQVVYWTLAPTYNWTCFVYDFKIQLSFYYTEIQTSSGVIL